MGLLTDGSATARYSAASSGTVSLTTSRANDVIFVLVSTTSSSATVSNVSASGLVFTRRTGNTSGTTCNGELWWAPSSGILTSLVITVNLNASANLSIATLAIAGSPNYISPFDTNASIPANNSASGNTLNPTISGINTNGANDYVLAMLAMPGAQTVTQPTGINQIVLYNSFTPTASIGSEIISVPLVSQTFTWTVSQSLRAVTIVDALIGTSATGYPMVTTGTSLPNPAGTTSNTPVVMGLNQSFVPNLTGKIFLSVVGSLYNNTSGDTTTAQLVLGSGFAPIYGASSVSGLYGPSSVGSAYGNVATGISATVSGIMPFECHALVSGITPNIQYWTDLQVASSGIAGKAVVQNLYLIPTELFN